MPRPLAPVLAAALLALPAPALAEPIDFDLPGLGAPRADVLAYVNGHLDASGRAAPTAGDQRAALDARIRFGLLSTDLALALSSVVLTPASTTGQAGFDVDLEMGYTGVHPTRVGGAWSWATRRTVPYELLLPSIHVRKALPWSFEVGGRLVYLAQSSYYAGQAEAKWAAIEGYELYPDVALRAAWTQLFGQREYDLGAGEVDLLVSKRFGVNAVASLTPYVAARYTIVNASSSVVAFGSVPAGQTGTPQELALAAAQRSAAFPTFRAGFYRTTAGVRMTAAAVSLAAEVTSFAGAKYRGEANPGANEYPSFTLKGTWGGAVRLGFEF